MTEEDSLKKEFEYNKKVEIYSHKFNAYITNRMEVDKAIITLSTAGIGLLITFFKEINLNNHIILYIFSFSIILFLFSIVLGIYIFIGNSNFLKLQLKDTKNLSDNERINHESKKNNIKNRLKNSDYFLYGFFILAIIFSISFTLGLILKDEKKDTIIYEQLNNDTLKEKIKDLSKIYIDLNNKNLILNEENIKLKEIITNNNDKFSLLLSEIESLHKENTLHNQKNDEKSGIIKEKKEEK